MRIVFAVSTLYSDRTVKDRAKIGEIEIQGAGDVFPIYRTEKSSTRFNRTAL